MDKLGGTANFHHQISLAFLVTNFNNSFSKKKKTLIATSETRIDYVFKKSKKYCSPDVIVWDFSSPINSVFWLENTTTRDLNKNFEKTIFAFNYLPNLTEAFVFNYQTNTFYRFERGSKKYSIDSKSKFLKLDLSKLIGAVVIKSQIDKIIY